MKYLLALLFAFVQTGCAPTAGKNVPDGSIPDTNVPDSSALQAFHVRSGLPNFFGKIRSGKEVRIAYIGGSITEANNGWRDLTFNWFQKKYPLTPFIEIDATIGGTGSDLGVFRMDTDVLPREPDLVFVEFAVNDFGRAEADIRKTMEGIVRKTWKKYPSADICFTYTLAENVVETMRKGRYQSSAVAMEAIAEHYQIPSVHMGVEVIRLLEAGKLIFTGNPEDYPDKIVFTKDKTHPLTLSGHPIYANEVIRFMQMMETNGAQKSHTLTAALEKENWEQAQMIPLSQFKLNEKWKVLPASDAISKRFVKFMPKLYQADPGASFTVKFKGKVLGAYDVIGPKTGIVEIIADGRQSTEIYRFDQWCDSYRKNRFFVKDLSDGVHEVTFQVPGKPFDKAEILKKRNITITNPADYAGYGWFANSVMLVGELID